MRRAGLGDYQVFTFLATKMESMGLGCAQRSDDVEPSREGRVFSSVD